jgi:ubiquinone/menaquinone biosynthesis C-methylase UbiE
VTITHHDIAYLDSVATSASGREYKRDVTAGLRLRPGQTVLDVGCGPGTDLEALAHAVGTAGRVIGIDHDPAMVEAARRRTADLGVVTVSEGDAHALPLPDHGVDAVRVDRVLTHVDDPGRVVCELRRVLRPGGRISLAEPDWDTLFIDDLDIETSRGYTRYITTLAVRNAAIGRQLKRLVTTAGFVDCEATAVCLLFEGYREADLILKIDATLERAVRAGMIDSTVGRRWLERVRTGPVTAGFTFFRLTAIAPD